MIPGEQPITRTSAHPKLVVVGHYTDIYSVRFSADGKFVVSDSSDTVIVWNVETREIERLLTIAEARKGLALPEDQSRFTVMTKFDKALSKLGRHRYGWRHDQLSPDGKLVADFVDGPEHGSLFVVVADTRTGRVLQQTLYRDMAALSRSDGLMFSNDGELIGATGEAEEGILLWNLRTGETRRVLKGQSVQLFNVPLSPDFRLVAISSDGRQIWDAETERLIQAVEETYDYLSKPLPWNGGYTSVSFSLDGSRSAMGIGQGIVMVREWETLRTLLWQTQSHRASMEPVSLSCLRTTAFSVDGHTLATGGSDHLIRLWDSRTGALLNTLGRPAVVIRAVAFAPDGKSLTALSDDGIARVWSLDKARLIQQEAHGLELPSWGVSPLWDTTAKLWYSARSALSVDSDTPDAAEVVASSPDGSLIAFKQQDGLLSVWNRSTRSLAATLPDAMELDASRSIAFSPDNRFLAMRAYANPLRLFDLSAAGVYHDLAEDASFFAFSPDGRTLAVVHDEWLISLWDVRTVKNKRMIKSPLRGPSEIFVLALSPNNTALAIVPSYDETVWIQPLGRRRKGIPLVGHKECARTVAFSPDGTRLATGAADGTVMLWDAATGDLLATLLALPEEEWVIFTPDDRYAASPGAEPYLRWHVSNDLLPIHTYAKERNLLQHL